jgi:hypothetical protein
MHNSMRFVRGEAEPGVIRESMGGEKGSNKRQSSGLFNSRIAGEDGTGMNSTPTLQAQL